jgi:uncharacterized membrane protein YgcG
MIKHKAVGAVVVAAALSFPLLSAAQSQPPIYGSQLMTQQERAQYRAHMRSLRTAQERERFRMEHHERMQERAQARGVTLPDMPPARGGRGMGPGGQGMGPGGGGPGGGGAGGR